VLEIPVHRTEEEMLLETLEHITSIFVIGNTDVSKTRTAYAPLESAKDYISVCQVGMSRNDAWKVLRDANYNFLLPRGDDTIFIVINVDDTSKDKLMMVAEGVARNVFGIKSPSLAVVNASEIQANLVPLRH
jgi:hypothetical protein